MEVTSVAEAKQYLYANWENGVECPCCRQHVKLYRRPITSSMAYALALILKWYKENKFSTGIYMHIEEHLKRTDCPAAVRGDVAKLKYWDLIEANTSKRDDGSPRNGMYRITQKGIDFVYGRITVPSHVMLYNNKKRGFSEGHISFQQALKNKFNYSKLMEGLL